MSNADYVKVPREWIEKLKTADGDTGIDLVEQLQSGHVTVFDCDSMPRPETDESEILQVIEQRDHWEEKATELAEAVGEHFGFSVGEHSSANCPVQTAIDALDEIAGAQQNASSSVKHDWESVKSVLATAIVGFASRESNKGITYAEGMLDALTEDGTGFEYLRAAFQNTAKPVAEDINPNSIVAWAKAVEKRHGTENQAEKFETLIADAVLEAFEWLRINEMPEDTIKERERIAMSRGIAVALSRIDFKGLEYHDIVKDQGGYEELLKDVEEYDREHLLMAAYANLEKEEADALMDKYGPKSSEKGSS